MLFFTEIITMLMVVMIRSNWRSQKWSVWNGVCSKQPVEAVGERRTLFLHASTWATRERRRSRRGEIWAYRRARSPRATCSAMVYTWPDAARRPGGQKLSYRPGRDRNGKGEGETINLWECDQMRAQLYYLKHLKEKKAAKDLYILFPLFFPEEKEIKMKLHSSQLQRSGVGWTPRKTLLATFCIFIASLLSRRKGFFEL